MVDAGGSLRSETSCTGADLLVESLVANQVKTLFGLPGGQLDHLFDALYRNPHSPRLIRARHEQGAAWMAFGAARSTGSPAVYATVPGPGVMNTMAALVTAWATNAPVMSLCGQIPSAAIGSGRGYLHEIPNQLETLSTVVKQAVRVGNPVETNRLFNETWRTMNAGRPGPVHLEMAPDIMASDCIEYEVVPAAGATPPVADHKSIAQAVELLSKAKQPLIYVGGGAAHASDTIRELAQWLQAPVTCFRSGRGIVDDRHYLSQVFPAGRRLWAEADVVLAIGTRLKYPQLYWGVDDNLNIIRLDIDIKEFERYAPPTVALHGDSATTLPLLLEQLKASTSDPAASREEELQALKDALTTEMHQALAPQMAYLNVIRDTLPEDGIFCDEITQHGFVSWYGFPVYMPRSHINCGFQGTLGYGFATALGVKIAHPDRPVISISGDGGFLYTATELATAVEYKINLISIVFNDNRYANVYRQQKEWFAERFLAADLHNPDFVSFAQSFGARAERVDSPEGLRCALVRALDYDGPTVIEARQAHDLPTPWQYILEAPVRGVDA